MNPDPANAGAPFQPGNGVGKYPGPPNTGMPFQPRNNPGPGPIGPQNAGNPFEDPLTVAPRRWANVRSQVRYGFTCGPIKRGATPRNPPGTPLPGIILPWCCPAAAAHNRARRTTDRDRTKTPRYSIRFRFGLSALKCDLWDRLSPKPFRPSIMFRFAWFSYIYGPK